MLMYTISFALHETMTMTILNRYLDIELTSSVYFCNFGTYYEYPLERMDSGTMTKIEFRFDPDQDKFEGISIYKVQRKGNTRFSHQYSVDKAIEEALKRMRLLITWKIEHSRLHKVKAMLIECDNELVLSEDKLTQLYEKINRMPPKYYESTWLMCDNTALEIEYEVVKKEGLELKITISGGVESRHAKSALRIDLER
jgi:hypothetical protein